MVITREQVRATFIAEGISIKEWAKTRGYHPIAVYRVIAGKVQCKRGVSHKIAVELGLKAAPKRPRLLPEKARAA
jgi:gp16 family phage-associated protein